MGESSLRRSPRCSSRRVIVGCLCLYIVLFIFSFFHFSSTCEDYTPDRPNILQKKVNDTTIVITWESEVHWAGWGEYPYYGWAGYNVKKKECPYHCKFTGNQSMWPVADVVLFEPQPFGRRGPKWPGGKICGQKWLMFTYETALYFPRQGQRWYRKKMDWIMDYTRTADVQVSLTCDWNHPLDDYRIPPPPLKHRFAVFVASNCDRGGADKRTAYVKELMKYIPIDSYGLCLQNVPPESFTRNTDLSRYEDKIKLFRDYKFVLAFENSNTSDYISEKLSQAILGQSLPVFMGAANVDDWLPAPHSVIRTDQFASPRALADYLLEVNASQSLYDSYFAWKSEPLSDQFLRTIDNCVFDAECRLCKRVVQERENYQATHGEYVKVLEVDEDFFLLHICLVLLILLFVCLWRCFCYKYVLR